jgi:GDP/UDP-N,N'-diacetylbacillosamine 2-epimerase (hydrolysing)
MRKIAVVTGTRAEYGILLPVLKAIENEPGLSLSLVVTGMHLSHDFGYTVDEIEKDGFEIAARVNMLPEDDTLSAMAKSIGTGITGMVQVWEKLKPDIILVLGDRVEPLAAAIAGAYMNIAVAHIHGGDASWGGLDEYARHAITKLSHIHFPATKTSAERIKKMGEDEWRIHMVGSPALDAIMNEEILAREALIEKLGMDLQEPLILMVQHPVTTQVEEASSQIRETLDAVAEMAYQTIVIYPNSDAGGKRMIPIIKEYEDKYKFIQSIKSLPRKEYLSLMKIASVMLGNSSSGIIDALALGLPSVNIGIRQQGRERGDNVIDVAHNKAEIISAVRKSLEMKNKPNLYNKNANPYGDGSASEKIVEVLDTLELSPRLIQKKIAY